MVEQNLSRTEKTQEKNIVIWRWNIGLNFFFNVEET